MSNTTATINREAFQVIAGLIVDAKMHDLEDFTKAMGKNSGAIQGALNMTRNALKEVMDTMEDELFNNNANAGQEG